MLFASKGLFAKFAYARGVQFEALVVIRAVLAMPLFWLFAVLRGPRGSIGGTRPGAVAAAALAGVLCYYVGALTDFYALTLIDASVERVLLFSYPALVVLLSALLRRQRPSGLMLLALACAYLGIFLAVGGLDPAVLRANVVGAGFVLISAFTYALYFMIGERYTREIGAARYTLFAMSAAAIALAVHFVLRGGIAQLPAIDAGSWLLLVGLAVFCMFIPALLQAEGVRRIGAQRGSIVSTAGPPTTIALAWLLLGERMTLMQLLGVALIIGGILLLELRRRG